MAGTEQSTPRRLSLAVASAAHGVYPEYVMADEERNTFSAAEKLPDASAADREAIDRQSRPSAALIHETIRAEGESELERTVPALLLSGFAAGLSMGFSLVAEGLLRSRLPDAPWRDLVAHLGYTFGFLVVVLGRQQLFTENTLTPILPLLYHRDAATVGKVARLWGAVLAANIAATWVFAAVIAHAGVFGTEAQRAFAEVSRNAVEGSFGDSVLRGIFAGWLIALMVWLLPAAETARPVVIIVVTYVVALGHFTHVVAGSVDAAYLVSAGAATLGDYVWKFFVPTLIGNVIGGVTLVAALNYGQVKPEIE
jgi:formate/nitrite transporter FocA (FNT family)